MCSGTPPIDVQALKKKVSRVTCDPGVQAILSNLLLYVTDHEVGPQGPPLAAGSRASHAPEPQDTQRRPTRFQLLQAKFMGSGREPRLKRTREVGRLIFKDKQGPGKGLVTATIHKLLEKAGAGADGPAQGREREKARPPAGRSSVKNILKAFLAAEEKEAQEKPLSELPKAAKGLLPKVGGRRSLALTKLREKFEQSGGLCAEAAVLPLRLDQRKKKHLPQKQLHRPELRVLRTATWASTCVRAPPARFLACSAEPVLPCSIATVVCGPRSWLSRGARVTHRDVGLEPRGEAGTSLHTGAMAPSGSQVPGWGQPPQPPAPWTTTPRDSLETVFPSSGPEFILRAAPSPASPRDEALRGCEPVTAPLGPASPGCAGAAGGKRTGDAPGARGAGLGPWPGLVGEGAGAAPDVILRACCSEDETDRATADTEPEPLFAVQENLPEEKAPGQIPPLAVPAAQAARRTQPAMEPPQITVRLPVVHTMPPPAATPQRANGPHDHQAQGWCLGGEGVCGNTGVPPPTTAGPTQQGLWPEPTPVPLQGAAHGSPGIPKVVVPKAGVSEAGVLKVGVPKAGVLKAGVPKASVSEAGVPKVGVPKASEESVPKAGILKADVPKAGVLKASVSEAGVSEVSVPKAGVSVAGVPKAGVLKAGVPKAGISEAGVPKASVSEAGVPKASVSEAGVPKAGVSEASVPKAGVPKASVSEAGVLEAGVPKVGVSEAGVSKAGVSKASVSEAGVLEAGVPKVGVFEAGVSKAGVSEASVPKAGVFAAGVPKAGVPEAGVSEAGVPKAGVTKAGVSEAGVPKAGVPKAIVSEAGVLEAGVPKVGVSEAGVSKAGVSEASVPKAGVFAAGVPKAGVSEAGVSEAGVPKAGVTKAGVSEAGVPKADVLKAIVSEAGVLEAGVPKVGVSEAGVSKAGVPKASISKAGVPKASVSEAGVPKAGVSEAGVSKASISEAGVPKASISEAGVLKAGVPKTNLSKAGVSEVGVPKAGVPKADISEAGVPKASISEAGVLKSGVPKTNLSKAGVSEAGVPKAGVPKADISEAGVPMTAVPETVPPREAQRCGPGGKETKGSPGVSLKLQKHEDIWGQAASQLSSEAWLPERLDWWARDTRTPPHHSEASESQQRGLASCAPGSQQTPVPEAPSREHQTGIPTRPASPAKGRMKREGLASADKSPLHEQGRHRGPLSSPELTRPLLATEGSTSHDLGENRVTSLNERPKPSVRAPGQVAAAEAPQGPPAPATGNTLRPQDRAAEERASRPEVGRGVQPPGPALVAKEPAGLPRGHGTCRASGSLPSPRQEAPGAPGLPVEPPVAASGERAAGKTKGPTGGGTAGAMKWSPSGGSPEPPTPARDGPAPQGGHAWGARPRPLEKQRAEGGACPLSAEQPPLGAGPSRQPPLMYTAAGGQRVDGAAQEHPDLRAPGEVMAGHRQLPGADLGSRGSPRGREQGGRGPVSLDSPGRKGEAAWRQKAGWGGAEGAASRALDEAAATEEATSLHTGKGPERPAGQRGRGTEGPPRGQGHWGQAAASQAPPLSGSLAGWAQAPPSRVVPLDLARPSGGSAEVAPAIGKSGVSQRPDPRGGQCGPGKPRGEGESLTAPSPQPGQGPTAPLTPAQQRPPDPARAGTGTRGRGHGARAAHLAKYRAQSFSDQRSFELSFRPMVIRANDTFALPK